MATTDRDASGMEPECIHAAPSDGSFTRRMRFHQSWYRRHVLRLPPGRNRGKLYGNLLTKEDGDAGRNFLDEASFKLAEQRVLQQAGVVEADRLLRNLLSSQPMCFNLFGPLATDLELATRLISSLPGLPEGLRVTSVTFEFAPEPSLHLDDKTAFDVFVEYTHPTGDRGFIGIETKLTEPFSQKSYEFGPRYSRWSSHPRWWWDGAETHFPEIQFNQIWRNHLLAFAMLHQEQSDYSEGFCAVVYPEEDDRACGGAIRAYRRHLRPAGEKTLLDWPLGNLLGRWAGRTVAHKQHEWINAFRLRYLGLDASNPAWELHQGSRA